MINPNEIEIILVEDNADDAFFTIRAFKEANADNRIVHIKNGAAALDFFFKELVIDHQSFQGLSKLILLDLRLPKVDGIEILKQLKQNQHTSLIPVVILTSVSDDPIMYEALKIGADSYLIKPVTYEGYLEIIKALSTKYGR
jgi:DNA-binding response OmpR family regulator